MEDPHRHEDQSGTLFQNRRPLSHFSAYHCVFTVPTFSANLVISQKSQKVQTREQRNVQCNIASFGRGQILDGTAYHVIYEYTISKLQKAQQSTIKYLFLHYVATKLPGKKTKLSHKVSIRRWWWRRRLLIS